MDTTVKDIFFIIDEIAPFKLAEEWDNCGLQAGNLLCLVKKILVALDISMDVMDHAVASNVDLVVSHHPLMLRPPKSIDFSMMPGSVIESAAKHKISIISAHTNLDKVYGGLNDHFANIVGLKNISTLIPSYRINDMHNMDGIGRIGELDQILSLKEFAFYIKKRLNLQTIRMAGYPELPIKRVAICTGSGGSLLKDVFKSGVDAYITGDIKYHEAREFEEAKVGLIDVGHFASERIVVELLCNKLKNISIEKSMNLEIEGFYADSDPFITLA